MAELLGVLLALAIVGTGRWVLRLGLRLWAALRPRLRRPRSAWRDRRLRLARGRSGRQAARIAHLTAELDRARLALRVAERRQGATPAGACGCGAEERFRRAKRAFALHFHPDRLHGMEPREARLRRRVFRDFWSVLRRIELG